MDEDLRRRAIALHDDFTHNHGDRRRFMADAARLAGGVAAAELLVAGIAASPAAATIVAETDPRIKAETATIETAPGRTIRGYLATPAKSGRHPGVVVIHENRGLQPYTQDVARRLAVAGFAALAPDLLTPAGGTPLGDDDKARTMIGALDLAATTKDVLAVIAWLGTPAHSTGKVGVVGFCWGGAMADRIAVEGGRAAAGVVAFYGPAPDPSQAIRVETPLMLHYAGLDTRVDATAKPWVAALQAAHKNVRAFTYPNVDHAFHNDTAGVRYNAAAATLAWDRTLAFFKETLS